MINVFLRVNYLAKLNNVDSRAIELLKHLVVKKGVALKRAVWDRGTSSPEGAQAPVALGA